MINIKIDKKDVEIPTYSELTVKQYGELLPFIAESGAMDILRYISVTSGTDYDKALHFEFRNIERLNSLVGNFKFISGDLDQAKGLDYIETTKPPKVFQFGKFIYDLRGVKLTSIGYRIVLEQYMKTKPSYLDIYIFMAAIVINVERDNPELAFDYDTVLEVVASLQDYDAFKVLTIGSFFFWKWSRSVSKESRRSRMLKRVLLTSTRLRSRNLVLIDSRNIPLSTK